MRLLLRLSLITVLSGLGLAMTGVALVPAARQLQSAGSSQERPIDLGPLDQRSYVFAADGSLLATLRADVDRQPVPLAFIPTHVSDAVMAVEDADFYAHKGVNLRAMLRALTANVESGSTVQGGSTITQQLVKNELVGSEQTIGRKAREAVLARRLEDVMTKDEILERYLNTVYLGNGAYGMQAGAETYFGVSVAELDIAQAAFLAGMIANPSAFDPIRHPEASLERRNLALRRLVTFGRITEAEADQLAQIPLPDKINQILPQPDTYFVEEVKQLLLDDVRLGATREEREYAVFRGGLQIHTTLDPRAQSMALQARNDVIAELAPKDAAPATIPLAPNPFTGADRFATGAVVSVEPSTGAIRAMVGGSGFEKNKFNVTTQGLRSGGSTFKVFVLMALLEAGYVPNDTVSGSGPCSFTGIPGLNPDPYVVENFDNSRGGSGTITQQTLRSSNCAFVRLGQIVGTDRVAEQARRMGITTPIQDVVSMPLGTQEVYPLDMAAAVSSIANDGELNPPYYIDRVEDRSGQLIFQHTPNPRRASTPESARLAADVLEQNVQSGTGTRARIPGQHAAGKTGTAQNSGNGWFVGFTPYLATAVWMGSPDDNFEVKIGGRGITGGSYPAEIWGRYMRAWHQGLPTRDFPAPPRTRAGHSLRLDRSVDKAGGSTSSKPKARRPSSSGSATTTTTADTGGGGATTTVPAATTTTAAPSTPPPVPADPPPG
ncbi:MAG TPA: transglycosylase domain-containing protein [Acidimicrobiales bacterium]|nr:transglycosylase domain-containing protein [Acidimicrobiales bacterium]